MMTIGKDTDLVNATVETVNWEQHGWETCTASAFNVVIYTYNEGAAYSDDPNLMNLAVQSNRGSVRKQTRFRGCGRSPKGD